MKSWWHFVIGNKRLLNFGFLYNLFSSFGQTFFVSLFVPIWVASFDITNAAFGSIYATVTIVAAFLLSLTGKYIDKISLVRFSLIVFIGLIISVILLSQAYNLVFLVGGLLLVRWLGQGMMTHTSATGIAKYFTKNRGKALGFTALGNPIGQLVLPLLVIPLIALVGWRSSLLYVAAAAIIIVIPSLWALKPVTNFSLELEESKNESSNSKENYLLNSKFWIIAFNSFVIPFLCTALFLYQYTIGNNFGWETSWIAFSFAFYAIFYAVSLILSGNLVDHFSGIKLFPLYLIPTILALIVMALTNNKYIFPVFYALLGVSAGLGNTIRTAVQVEIYGKKNLGKIRSYFSTLVVVSTALGPPIFGFFIDRNYSFNAIMLGAAVFVILITLISFRVKNNDNK